MRMGIDTGGTFTDLVFIGAGEVKVHKVPSTPGEPLQTLLSILKEIRSEGPASLPLYYRPQLPPGYAFWGPALVLEDYASLLVLPGFRGEVLPQGHVLLTRR
jgi:N-methylhydantoinase A/oxoprolinase/acetone carboxylase beta subunit